MLIQTIHSLLYDIAPALQAITTSLALQLSLQKAIALFNQANCFRIMGNMVKLMNSMIMGPLPYLIHYEGSSLIKSNAVQSTIMGDKEFCMSTDGNSAEALYAAKANPYIEKCLLQ